MLLQETTDIVNVIKATQVKKETESYKTPGECYWHTLLLKLALATPIVLASSLDCINTSSYKSVAFFIRSI